MAKLLFITGTDTGIGKTHVACLLAQKFSSLNMRVALMKPFASGSMSDTRKLRKAANIELKESQITPFFFKASLAPYAASLQSGERKINLQDLDRGLKRLMNRCDLLIVEGIGGLCVPISLRYLLAHWVARHCMPTIIVCHPWLGTINHTMLTVHYARSLHIPIEGIVFNRSLPRKETPIERSNLRLMRKLTNLPIIGNVPYRGTRMTQKSCFNAKWIKVWENDAS